MKKFYISFIILFLFVAAKSNPIMPPPLISEIYYDGNNWFIEIVGCSYYPSFEYYGLKTTSGIAIIKNKIDISQDNALFVITADSVYPYTPLTINPGGDFLQVVGMQDLSGSYQELSGSEIYFGNIEYSEINAPKAGQSIKAVQAIESYNPMEYYYFYVLDNQNTIGADPFNANINSTVRGYVIDSCGKYIKDATVYGIFYTNPYPHYGSAKTDTTGFFVFSPDYAKRYYLKAFIGSYEKDTTINPEPDSINIYYIHLDTCLGGFDNINYNLSNFETNLTCYPNPSNNGVNIRFRIPDNNRAVQTILKIYNITGEIVKIIPINTGNIVSNTANIFWDGGFYNNKTSSGEYICCLEINGRIKASTKIILTR